MPRRKPKTSGGYGTATIRSQRRNQAIVDAGGKVTSVALNKASVVKLQDAEAAGWKQNEAINAALAAWKPDGQSIEPLEQEIIESHLFR